MRSSRFFEGVHQMRVPLGDGQIKVPVFYYDGSAMTGVFPARLSALRRWMPDRRFVPARLAPGIGAVTITCFEYRDTDIDPYNELAIAVPLSLPHTRANAPGRAMLGAVRRGQYDIFVHHLPVTTELACRGGIEFYNYPKFVAAIEYDEGARVRRCRLAEGAAEILTMTLDRSGGGAAAEIQLFCHLYQDRQPQRAEFKIHAPQMERTIVPGAARLALGREHPIARELAAALLSTRSIAATWAPRIEGILYGPEVMSPTLIDRLVLSPERAVSA